MPGFSRLIDQLCGYVDFIALHLKRAELYVLHRVLLTAILYGERGGGSMFQKEVTAICLARTASLQFSHYVVLTILPTNEVGNSTLYPAAIREHGLL